MHFTIYKQRWANQKGLEMWNATSLEELQSRSFADLSVAMVKMSERIQLQIEAGQNVPETWTLYPKGQAKVVHMNISAITLSHEEDHCSMFFEGIPYVKEELVNDNLRGVEMIRHLPISVCQFDMEGHVMFQNPEAAILYDAGDNDDDENADDDDDAEEDNCDDDNTDSSANVNDRGEQIDTSQSKPENNDTNEVREDDIPSLTGEETNNKMEKEKEQSDDKEDCRSTATTTVDDDDGSIRTSESLRQQQQKDRRFREAGGLLNRFVDQTVGKQVLKDIRTQDTYDLEAMLKTQKGPKWCAIQFRKATDPVTGEPVILFSARDNSDAVRAEKEKEAREQKSEFLAIMAHEIRTPLHQVTGFIDLLDQTILSKEQKSFVRLLKTSAFGLMSVINDVLDYSKLEAGKMKLECIPYEPRSVIQGSMEAVRTGCEEKKLYLNLDCNKDIPFKVMGDPNRLRQILLNLLSNAVKFTKKGGVTVTARLLRDDEYDDNNSNNNSSGSSSPSKPRCDGESSKGQGRRPMVKFTVKDTGIGVGDDCKNVIFQKYQQANASVARNFGGTGLGLSICQLLVRTMGGTIGVESELGKGAAFWFILPAELPVEQEPVEPSDHEAAIDIGCLNILVAEDNKVNQKLAAHMLRRMGHKSKLAENGKVAIEMIQKEKFDVVLMDIQMPV